MVSTGDDNALQVQWIRYTERTETYPLPCTYNPSDFRKNSHYFFLMNISTLQANFLRVPGGTMSSL